MRESKDRVRDHTDPEINKRIDDESSARLKKAAYLSSAELSSRIEDLDGEWDIERYLELNASVLAFSGLMLGAFVSKKWLLLPGVVLPFLVQHAVQGWCPPLEIFRRLGIRTRHEIDAEKFALQVLRGDFDGLYSGAGTDRSSLAVTAYKTALPDNHSDDYIRGRSAERSRSASGSTPSGAPGSAESPRSPESPENPKWIPITSA